LQVTAYSDVRILSDGTMEGHFISRWIAVFAFLTPLLVWRLARSPRGQAIRAVREDEVAAAAVGIDTTRQKVTAFVIGAAWAGVGGGLFAHCFYYLNPNSFGFMRSVELVVMVTIAGLGNVWWTVVWAAALTYLEEDFLRTIGQHLGYPQLAQWRMVLYSLLLILIPISQARLFPRLSGALRWKTKLATDQHR
jgi:branched-chain amino acid transport system permease protein